MKVLFDTKNIYYLPQYTPIIDELIKRGYKCELVTYEDKNNRSSMEGLLANLPYTLHWVKNEISALELYQEKRPDWVFFGNRFAYLDRLHEVSKTAQLGHGVGPKPSYYTKSRTPMTVRFIEGKERLLKIQQMFPNDSFIQVGFSKLDPLFNQQQDSDESLKLNLDSGKKTILYAPTFNPSSIECFPNKWPEEFSEYNILIKAHAFTWQRKAYSGQRKKINKWSKYDNVYVAKESEFSLLPFMARADILLSEASSTLFEFAALDRPVVVCDFFYLKWLYRGPFKYRFEKRFGKDSLVYKDLGEHVSHYRELKSVVSNQLNNPHGYHEQRQRMTENHIGPTDGRASERIVDYLEQI